MATAAMTGGREMAVGSVLTRAFGAIGAAPLRFFGISGVLVALPSLLVRAVAASGAVATTDDSFAAVSGVAVTGGLGWWVLYMAAQAMLFRATVGTLDGDRGGVGEGARAAARRLLPLLGLSIVLTLAVWTGFGLLVVPGVILATMWSVAAPALVLEEVGVFGSMGRSRRLTKGARWRILGLVLLVFAIYFVAATMLGLGSVAMSGFGGSGVVAVSPSLPAAVASTVLTTAFVTVWSAIQATLYVELRDWKDGFAGDRLADIFS